MGVEEYADMMPHIVSVEPFQGNDKYGEPSYGTSMTYQCRVVGKTKLIRDQGGREQVSTHTVYMNSTSHFSPKDRVTLPVGYSPNQPPIIGVGVFPDEADIHHTVLYLA